MILRRTFALLVMACALSSAGAQQADPLTLPSAANPFQQQPEWAKRRVALAATLKGVHQGDPAAIQELDRALTEFEHVPFSRTPLENLDLVTAFYLPREGVEKCFVVIVANQVLGWYDALRFASESGRAAIVNNVNFFSGPYLITKTGPALTKLIKEQPEKARQLFAQGISSAERFRDTENYDRRWPQAFGMERIICAQSGECKLPPELPRDQWQSAWIKAKERVAAYYLMTPQQPSAPN